jgi:hypothetical protein
MCQYDRQLESRDNSYSNSPIWKFEGISILVKFQQVVNKTDTTRIKVVLLTLQETPNRVLGLLKDSGYYKLRSL